LITLGVGIFKIGWKLSRIEMKVNLLWDFHRRRGRLEAIQNKLLLEDDELDRSEAE
jgi:hypothetical protein